ncbi:DNA topoisomerase III [Bacillus thuringiensis serovar medellin]|uniref:DNA topoisomerase n=1 Tax=Bacillus thuringiensis subsp. medellin TaxID=79672 RepID=A0A9X6MUI7_BACTV|nr:type IA DNA topoisomerase [Bacillus thuringiensis]OUB91307.1 DNA topoisomerase III [Bacillus thuringiensis serovar medellin]
MKAVIIAEKPSVAKNIADALKIKRRNDGFYEGDNYIVTWAFGHLLQLYDAKDYDKKMAKWHMDNFPFIPEKFQYKVKSSPTNREKVDSGAKKQLDTIRSLLFRDDVESIISACDYDREGQVIGDSVIYNIKAPKQVYRLLLNEWTPDEVNAGLKQIRPNSDLRPLQDAGVSRQWADWAIGINLTSVATLKYQKGGGQALNIGRVLLPTLKVIYDRDKEIETFVPENYYKLVATFKTKREEEFEATYMEEQEDKFKTKATLDEIYAILQHSSGVVLDKQVERKREYPPFLFNLSNLQGYVTSKYKGWTSDKVLKVAQSLYEKKYITYPRTGSTALEESLVGRAAKVLEAVKKGLPYEDEISFVKTKRVFNNAKVESHSAIMPTYVIPKSLTGDEQIVYTTIKNRFIMQFMPVAEHEETRIQIKISDSSIKGLFIAKGRVQIIEGWRKVEKIESKDNMLPFVEVREDLEIVNAEVTSHVTKPPKHHTEKTLLRVMETCGKNYDEEEAVLSGFSIGTPATRAETIKKLKDIGYVFSKDKSLLCSELGRKIVETFPVKELFDLEFTGKLEKALSDMEKKKVSRSVFLNFIFDFTRKSVEMIKNDQDIILHHATREPKQIEVLGKCPICSGSIVEGQKGFGCSDWKNGCKFVIWKNDKFLAAMKKKPNKTMVKKLLKDGEVLTKGLTSKKGNKFDAILRYEKNSENEFFSWKMSFMENSSK